MNKQTEPVPAVGEDGPNNVADKQHARADSTSRSLIKDLPMPPTHPITPAVKE